MYMYSTCTCIYMYVHVHCTLHMCTLHVIPHTYAHTLHGHLGVPHAIQTICDKNELQNAHA